MMNKKTGSPFSPGQPGHPPPADPKLSVSRLLGIWLYHGTKEKTLKRNIPVPLKVLFSSFLKNHLYSRFSDNRFYKYRTIKLPEKYL